MRTGKLDEVDPEVLAQLLGEEARRTWEQLQASWRYLRRGTTLTTLTSQSLPPGPSEGSPRRP